MKTEWYRRRPGAFTLLEMLVATAILAVIVTALASIASEASRIWTSTEALNQRRSTGRTLLQFIARDLEMAAQPQPYPRLNPSANLQFTANDPSSIPADLLNPHAVFWQAPIAADQTKGDLAEIGYFVRWDTTSLPGIAKAQLCRFVVDPSDATNYRIYASKTNGTPENWLDASTIDAIAPATAAQDYRGWFADNVIALWVRCLDSQGKPILKTAAGSALNGGYGFNSREGFENPSTGLKQTAPALPASVDIAIVSLDGRTAKRISAPLPAAPNSPANFWKDKNTPGSIAHYVAGLPAELQPGVQVFSTRIFLKNPRP